MRPVFELKLMTIQEFRDFSAVVDMDPIGQRLGVETTDEGVSAPSKSQGIISSIFLNKDIAEIKIVRNLKGEAWPFESIDGGHRKRAILRYLNNTFRTHKTLDNKMPGYGGKFFRELSDDQKADFLNYTLRIVQYPEMANAAKGEAFRDANYGTPVNHQEMLNSYGNIPIASFIRNTCRVVPRLGNKVHDLFDCRINTKGEVLYKNLCFANRRLDHDERVARIAYLVYIGEKLDVCDKQQLKEMYADQSLDDQAVKTIAKKVEKCLDFMLQIAEVRRKYKNYTGLNSFEFTILYRLYFYFKGKYGDFKIIDTDKFFCDFDKALLKFVGKNENNLIKKEIMDGKEPRMMFEAFRGYMTVHTSKRKIIDSCKWLIEEAGFDPVESGAIRIVDTKRCFSRAEIEEKLAYQNYKCWVTGLPLTMKDAQGAHIVPHTKGGETSFDNLVVVSAEHNRKMGEMNAYDYRDLYEQKVA